MYEVPMIERFKKFIEERESIRLKKEARKSKPWTQDRILYSYRFCNVNREDDKVTRWIAENIRKPYADHESLWFNLVLSRFINDTETLGELGLLPTFGLRDESKFLRVLDERQKAGKKLFGNAYMIRAGTGADAGKPKHHYLAERVFGPLWRNRKTAPGEGATCADWSDWYSDFFSLGEFMRNQIITDMKYTRYLKGADDWSTFCLAGPGTTRGLNRLYGRPLKARSKQAQLNAELLEVREMLTDHPLRPIFEDLNNLSNCFCEFDKYERARLNQGRPKQNYKGW